MSFSSDTKISKFESLSKQFVNQVQVRWPIIVYPDHIFKKEVVNQVQARPMGQVR